MITETWGGMLATKGFPKMRRRLRRPAWPRPMVKPPGQRLGNQNPNASVEQPGRPVSQAGTQMFVDVSPIFPAGAREHFPHMLARQKTFQPAPALHRRSTFGK